MRLCTALSVAMLTAAGFIGCSGSTSNSNPTPAGPLPVEELPDAYANGICDNLVDCCKSAGFAYDAQTCKSTFKKLIGSTVGLVQKGTVLYDANAAGACAAAFPGFAKSCLQGEPGSADCDKVFAGTVQSGGACTDSAECIAPAGGDADCDQGKCVPAARGVAGDACTATCTEEGSTTYCSASGSGGDAKCFTNDGLYCGSATSKCEKRVAIGGQGCDSGEASSCVKGAFCDNQTCVAQKAMAADCSYDEECLDTAYCDTTCVAKKPLGAACTDDFSGQECIDGACEAQKCAQDSNSTLGYFCGG